MRCGLRCVIFHDAIIVPSGRLSLPVKSVKVGTAGPVGMFMTIGSWSVAWDLSRLMKRDETQSSVQPGKSLLVLHESCNEELCFEFHTRV